MFPNPPLKGVGGDVFPCQKPTEHCHQPSFLSILRRLYVRIGFVVVGPHDLAKRALPQRVHDLVTVEHVIVPHGIKRGKRNRIKAEHFKCEHAWRCVHGQLHVHTHRKLIQNAGLRDFAGTAALVLQPIGFYPWADADKENVVKLICLISKERSLWNSFDHCTSMHTTTRSGSRHDRRHNRGCSGPREHRSERQNVSMGAHPFFRAAPSCASQKENRYEKHIYCTHLWAERCNLVYKIDIIKQLVTLLINIDK